METLEIVLIIITILFASACAVIYILIIKLDLHISLKRSLNESGLLQYGFDKAICSCRKKVYFRTPDCDTYNHYNVHTVHIKDTDEEVIMVDLVNVKYP
jgi:hypothetical protein